jgi:hypothetical protein
MKRFLFAAGFFITAFTVYSQTEATTKSGAKVLLHPNGTWTYAGCEDFVTSGTYSGGKRFLSSKENIIISPDNGATGVKISMHKGTDVYLINIDNLVTHLICVTTKAPITLEFTDGYKVVTQHALSLNCKAEFGLSLGNTKDDIKLLDLLKVKKLKQITIEYTTSEGDGTKKYNESFIFNAAQSERFIKTLQCLSNS